MDTNLQQYFHRLDSQVDSVRKLSSHFCQASGLTGFAYVRIYNDGRVGWITSDADHDRLLADTGFFNEDPLIDTAKTLKKGHYLWFHNRKFEGSEFFYQQRAAHFQIDHGMVVVTHQRDYLETACFSGFLAHKPLYNIFLNELGIFRQFTEHVKRKLTLKMKDLLEEGLHIQQLKRSFGNRSVESIGTTERALLIRECGLEKLLLLSKRECQCLALVKDGLTNQAIGSILKLSPRTVEHYLISVKNKLCVEKRFELIALSHKLFDIGLSSPSLTL